MIVQTRLIRLKATGANAARLHLRYLERDGVTREGLRGELYDAKKDRAEARDFVQRTEGDRHQFRFIVSPEDGAAYDDLKPFVRRLMEQMENDLGTELDWVAVNHYNTAHPHTHIVLRGKDDKGDDLIIAREYIAHGMRERAAEIVSLDLGPRTDREIQSRLQQEIDQERFTSIDRELLRDTNTDRFVQAANRDAFRQNIRAGRLQKLNRLGLAEDVGSGLWRLEEGMEPTLRAMGERGDIIKTIHRELVRSGVERSAANYAIHGDALADQARIVGRVLARGLADELQDRYYLIVDGVDGRSHYVGIGQGDVNEPTRVGTIVALSPRGNDVRQADRVIADIAKQREGRYSADLHHEVDPKATAPYIETHIRRLEDLRRAGAKVERHGDGSWTIPGDYLRQVKQIGSRRVRQVPVAIEILARSPITSQTMVQGATWLDRELLGESAIPMRDTGFGREVRDALQQRRQWLIEQDLAHIEQGHVVYRDNLLTELRRQDLARAGAVLAGEIGMPYAEANIGSRIDGVYRRPIDLASGRFAVIEKSREFTLVPWRPVLERNIGKPVSGIMREGAISWTLGRQRSGPSVT